MGRKDLEPEDRDRDPLTLVSVVECPVCACEFELVFEAPEGVYEVEDLTDPPVSRGPCPACGDDGPWVYDGWTVHEDAG
jgi:hypothetical protein